MKKILLSLFLGLTAVAGMAQTTKTYNEKLVVTVNDVPTDSIPANIQITKNEDGTCDFTLKNFCLISEDEGVIDTTGVGTINLKGVKMETKDGINNITTSQTIAIVPGDDPKIDYWLASIDGMLDAVPIVLTGKFDDTNLYVNIDIDMVSLGQTINVVVGQEKKVTSISTITNNNMSASKKAIYTLNGIRQSTTEANLSKGIYIIDGKKVIK
mgnify:CR=1 FL=1